MVMIQSLLRSVHEANVRNRLHRLAHGDAVLTRFEFDFTLPVTPANDGPPAPPTTMSFLVEPHSEPPTNLHVLVGRNGAGKTRCIQSLINTLLERPTEKAPLGTLRRLGQNQQEWTFAGLVSVSFSAFDDFLAPSAQELRIEAAFVGLRHQRQINGQVIDGIKGPAALAKDFVKSLERCRTEPRRTRWLRAVGTLATDPLFAEAGVQRLVELTGENWTDTAEHFFGRLSSGHAIVLLTTTRLVELVDERTLVVLDEPEGHLHPPLLSAFVRAIADLLVARNGVALIATHSPVVLQEVPKRCVWMLRRTLMRSTVERPSMETFGESAGVLTREVFGLEVTNAGFHQLVSTVASVPGQTYDGVEQHFSGQLGSEAMALARSLVTKRAE
ncbi:AAA family ATPase [Cupriavidus sp. UYPR2.512]|uniref:AAA family ATPase n=1 Tax=Cupriavidus sp. UYPR2.512 TaxID=1080187 RepID=UPI000686759B|nr:AAA family ATPase [Cupriavidus sp. UYPR2.512]UIF88921.1 AAA family ATPase [Cupriavidus necator]